MVEQVDAAMARYSGKRTGETSLLRELLDQLKAGDVLLADAMFSNYWTIALLLGCGVAIVSHHDNKRKLDFRKGRRLGRYDHRVNDRPDRIEPHAVKRRPKKLVYLNEPRSIAKARLLSGT